MQSNQVLTLEERFEFVRLILVNTVIFMFGLALFLGLSHNLEMEMAHTDPLFFTQIVIEIFLVLAFTAYVLYLHFRLLRQLMKKSVQFSAVAESKQVRVCFKKKKLQPLRDYMGDTSSFMSVLREVKRLEKEIPKESVLQVNKRLDDLYTVLGEYHLLNTVGHHSIHDSMATLIDGLTEEFAQILKEADQERISLIERKVKRMWN